MRRTIFILLLAILLMCFCAAAFKYQEDVKLKNGGELTSQTNGKGSSERIAGTGIQAYSRSLNSNDTYSNLISKYDLMDSTNKIQQTSFQTKENGEFKPFVYEYTSNEYLIRMASKNNLQHVISISDSKNLKSESSVAYIDNQVETNFSLKGSGIVRESVIAPETDDGGGRPRSVAGMFVNSNDFSIASGLVGETALQTDTDQSAKIEKVELGSTPTKPEMNEDLKAPGDSSSTIPEEPTLGVKSSSSDSPSGSGCGSETCGVRSGLGNESLNESINASEITPHFAEEPTSGSSIPIGETFEYEGLTFTKVSENYYQAIQENGQVVVMDQICRQRGHCKRIVRLGQKDPSESPPILADASANILIAETR